MNNYRYLSKFWLFIISIFTIFLLSYFNHYHKDWPNPNETVRLYLSLAIVERGDFNIDNEINKYGVIWDRAVHKNKIYSDKAPGISFAAAPALFVTNIIHKYIIKKPPALKTSYLISILFTSLLFTIISIIFFCKFASIYNLSLETVVLTLLTFLLGTYSNTYSMLFFGHQFAAALLFIAFVLIEMYLREQKRPFYILTASFLASYAFISEYPTIIISIILFVYLLIKSRDKRVLLYSISAIVPILLLMHYFNTCFGSIFSTGYQHLDSETFSKIHKEGFLGFKYPSPRAIFNLLFGSQRGLFFFSPALIFSIIYFAKKRSKSKPAILILVISTIYLLIISSFGYWIGGDAAGARHLIPLNYFLLIPLAFFLEENRNNTLCLSIFFGFLIISVHNIIVSNLSWPFFPPQFLNPLKDFSYILIGDGYITNSIINFLGIYGFESVGVFLFVVFLILILVMIFSLKKFYSGYIIAAQLLIIWVFSILILFPSRPDESNYNEIKRIENSFDPKPIKNIPFNNYFKNEYRICLKRGNMLLKRDDIIGALKMYRCIK